MVKSSFLYPLLLLMILPALVLAPLPASANQIREQRPLDFGVFAIMPNGASKRIVIDPNDSESLPDGGIIKLRGGHAATMRITQMDPSALFYITINNAGSSTPSTLSHLSGSPTFSIDTFTFDPPNDSGNMIHVNPDASLTINIGATLNVPSGVAHTPGPYRGSYVFMINF